MGLRSVSRRRIDPHYCKVEWPGTNTEAAFRRAVARKLSEVRKRRSMGIVELGERSGLAYPTVSRYLCGKRRMTIRALFKLADALGLTVEVDLVGEEPPERGQDEGP